MVDPTDEGSRSLAGKWRLLAWSMAAGLLLLPLLAMQFTDEVDWTLGDFAFAAVLIGGTGLAFELAVRISPNLFALFGFAVALIGAFLMIWINAAVGIVGSSANGVNQWYGLVLLVGLLIGAVGRFRPTAIVRATLATATAQALLAAIVLAVGAGETETPALELIAVNGFFMPFWLGAALLFRVSARSGKGGAHDPEQLQ